MIRPEARRPGRGRRAARRRRLRRADRGGLSPDAVRTARSRRSRADAGGARDRQRRRALRGHPARTSGRAAWTCRSRSRSSSWPPGSRPWRHATGPTSRRSWGRASTATGRRRRSTSCCSAASGTRPTRPYQPEISQGTLQSIYEYESLIAELIDLDVVSASHYDGAAATAEAALMACRATRRERVLVSHAVHPHYRGDAADVLRRRAPARRDPARRRRTGRRHDGPRRARAPAGRGRRAGRGRHRRPAELPRPARADGRDRPARPRRRARCSSSVVEPVSLAVLAPPGAYGADIAAGEGQPLGIAPQYGGPYLGLLASTDALVRQIPGRLVGMTTDLDGKRAYVMTLRAREQDIRRDKAASNICTNQALLALAASIYVATIGPHGLRDVAALGAARAAELEAALARGRRAAAPSRAVPQRVRDPRPERARRPSAAARPGRARGPRPRRRRARRPGPRRRAARLRDRGDDDRRDRAVRGRARRRPRRPAADRRRGRGGRRSARRRAGRPSGAAR